jgi:GR25 family glycosyltransferase involved in LPS biosynthesis
MNDIDQIYIINLKERTDRWEQCLAQLNKYNITNYKRFEAIKPNLTDINPIHYSKNNLKMGEKYIIGSLGCKLSHFQIILDAKQNNYTQILILEDDFLLTNNFIQKYLQISTAISTNDIKIDMLYLGFSIVRQNPYQDTEIDNLKKITNGHTTHAYILNESFFSFIMDEILNCYCEIDVCYAKLQKKCKNIYGVYPCLITQRESFSDILSKHVDYKKVINLDTK